MKRSRNGSKNMIFKNWLDTRPKMETHDPNVYPTILGGVSRGFWTPFLNRVARSAIFWHFERPDLKTESKNLAKHPPKWLGRHLGHAFSFSGEYQANFWKSYFLGPFYPLKRPKNENGSYFFVYGSIILKFFVVALLTYTHHWLTAISKIQKKVFFGTP